MLAAGKQKALLPYVYSNRAKKHSKQLSVSFIRTIPSAPDSHRINSCHAAGRGLTAFWPFTAGGEFHPALKQTFYLHSIPQVLQNARGYGIMFLFCKPEHNGDLLCKNLL